jgi:hypothetical protein
MPRHHAILFAIVSLVGCAEPSAPIAALRPALASTSPTRSAGESRAWKGRCVGTSVFTGPSTLFITGACEFAQFGRLTVVTTEKMDGFALSAVNRYTDADGDVLDTISSGSFTPLSDGTGGTFAGIETVVGGTGRFRDAVGAATRAGRIAFGNPNVGSYELKGAITLHREGDPADDGEEDDDEPFDRS